MKDPAAFVKERGWKMKDTGTEFEVPCPFSSCPNSGEPQFYINKKSGAFYCHRCNEKGTNLLQLENKLGLLKLLDPVRDHIFIPNSEVKQLHEALIRNKEAMEYLTMQRCFNTTAIIQHKLGYREASEGAAIVFPYFDTQHRCVGWKERYFKKPEGSKPKAKFRKDSKIQAYGLDSVDLSKTLIVVEGEADRIACWQYGYTNVVSVPTGAGGAGTEWINEIKGAPDYVLCFDNDQAGNEGVVKISDVLGRNRCKRAYPRMKDIGDMLSAGIPKSEVDNMFKDAEPLFTAPVTDIKAYLEDALEVLRDPEKARGISTGWPALDDLLGGIRPGEITVTSGMTGHGKTTFAVCLIGNFLEKDIPCLIVSPEMKERYLLLEVAANRLKKQVTKEEELVKFTKEYQGKIHIAKVFDSWTDRKQASLLDRVFDIIEYSVKHYGVKFVLLDHLRLFLNPADQDKERFAIDEFMARCVHCAISTKVHLWLVVQPKNLAANQRKVSAVDLKGSSNIGQDAHNIVLIHRNMENKKKSNIVEIEVAKNRELGTCGTITLEFDTSSKANYNEIDTEDE